MSRDSTTSTDNSSRPLVFEGNNWRPSRTSVVLGVLIAVGSVAVLVATSGLAAAAVAALAGLSAGGVLLFVTASRYRIAKRVCASFSVFVSGLLLLGCVALAFRSVRSDVLGVQAPATLFGQPHVVGTLLLVVGVAIAVGGASVTGRDSLSRHDYQSTVSFGILTISLPILAFAGLLTVELAGLLFDLNEVAATTGDLLFGRTASTPIDYVGLVVTWLLTLVSLTFVRLGLKHLPIAELAPQSRRERLKTRLNGVQSMLYRLRFLLFVVPLCVPALELIRTNTSVGLTDTYLRVVSAVGTASALRAVLLGGLLFGAVGVTVGGVTKRLARANPRRTVVRSIPFVSGLLIVVAALSFSSEAVNLAITGPLAAYRAPVETLLQQYRPATLVVSVLVLVGGTSVGLYVALLTVDYVLLPEYADGAALASVGVFIASVGSLLSGTSPLVGFVGIAGSFVVWDINTNAVSLGRELGRHTPTRQSELVHSGGSLLVAALGTGVAMAGLLLTKTVSPVPESIAPVTAVVSIVALFALIVGLRGR